MAWAKKGFVLLPRSLVAKRSFAWAARFRRLTKDDVWLPDVLRGQHFLVLTILLPLNAASLLTATRNLYQAGQRQPLCCLHATLRDRRIG